MADTPPFNGTATGAQLNAAASFVSGLTVTTTEVNYLNGITGNIQEQLDAIALGDGVSAHSALSGLDGDDHPHYLNQTRADARYYTKTQVDSAIAAVDGGGNTDGIPRYTQAEYDGLTKDSATLYLVTGPVPRFYLGTVLIQEGVVDDGGNEPVEPSVTWGDVNTLQYRGETIPRTRSTDAAVSGTILPIPVGTSAASINSQISSADPNTPLTVDFAAGTHTLTQRVLITRGNITVKGAGRDETIFDFAFAQGSVSNAFVIQGPAIRAQSDGGSNRGRWRPEQNTLIGTVTQAFNLGDKSVTVDSTAGLAVGDYIMVFKPYVASGDKEELASMAQVAAINGNTITTVHKLAFSSSNATVDQAELLSDIKVYKTVLLENVTAKDFSITYTIPTAAAVNPNGYTLQQMLDSREINFFKDWAATDNRGLGSLIYGNHRTLSISGTHEANISNIRLYNIGSNGFWFSGNLELYANNIEVDECYNKGVGSNGYGVELDKCYYGEITNIYLYGCRHGLTCNGLGSNGLNLCHVAYTTSNSDFHGSRDQGNIYVIDDAVMEPYWMPVTTGANGSGDLTYELNFADGKYAFNPMTYREDINEAENTVLFRGLVAVKGTWNGTHWVDADGHKVNSDFGGSNDDIIYAAPEGANLDLGFGSDTVHGGAGDDIINLGVGDNVQADNSDIAYISSGSGNDTISSFDGYDVIRILRNANGSGFQSGADILAAATQVGSDVVITLGGGNTLTLQGVSLASLSSADFEVYDE